MTDSTSTSATGTDAWGRPLMQPNDGHGAWACNNYDCTQHPASLYGATDRTDTEPVQVIAEYSVCADCLHMHANGECGERPARAPRPWSLIPGADHHLFAMGTDRHATDCAGDTDDECTCADLGFRTSACEACGDSLHGDRYAMVRFNR